MEETGAEHPRLSDIYLIDDTTGHGALATDEAVVVDKLEQRCAACLRLEDMLDLVYEECRGLVPYDRIGYARVDVAEDRVVSQWVRSDRPVQLGVAFSGPLQGSTLHEIWARRRCRVIYDLHEYLACKPGSESTRRLVAEGMRSSLTCPLIIGEEVAGFVFFTSVQPRAYTIEHAELFRRIASALSRVLERGRMYSDLAERRSKIADLESSLRQLQRELAQCSSTTQIARVAVNTWVRAMDAAFARLWVIGRGDRCSSCPHRPHCQAFQEQPLPQRRCLHLVASAGTYTSTDGSHARIPLGAYKVGWIASQQSSLFSNDVQRDPRIRDHQWAREQGLVSFAGFPLQENGDVYGVAAMFGHRVLEPDDVHLLEVWHNWLSATVHGAMVADDLRVHRKRLRLAEAQYHSVMENAIDAILSTDEYGVIVACNPAAEQLFGYPAEELLGESADCLVSERFRARYRDAIAAYAADPRPNGTRLEWEGLRRNGTNFPAEIALSACLVEQGRLFTAIVRDLSQQRENERLRLQAVLHAESELAINRLSSVVLDSLLGAPPQVDGYRLETTIIPAERVAGDFYDLSVDRQRRLRVLLADVSGHGLATVPMVASIRTLVRLAADHNYGPQATVHQINDFLLQHLDTGQFVTLLYVVIDLDSGRFRMVNAGHPAPLLLEHSGGERVVAFSEQQGLPVGFPVGLDAEAEYQEGQGEMPSGSKLCLFTDGTTDVISAGTGFELFGLERFKLLLRDAATLDVGAIRQTIVRRLQEFAKPNAFHDDVTLVLIERCATR